MSSNDPLLLLHEARIEGPGGPLLEGVSASFAGDRLALVGPWDPLFRLLGGEASLTAGALRIGGYEPSHAIREGRLGIVLADLEAPPRWTGSRYLVESALLAGLGAASERRAREVIERLGLERLAPRPIRVMAPAERRAILTAHAILTDPELIALQHPLEYVDDLSAQRLWLVFERALGNRRWVVLTSSFGTGPSVRWADVADGVLVLGANGSVTSAVGKSGLMDGRRYFVTVVDPEGAFVVELERRGVRVISLAGPTGQMAAPLDSTPWPVRFLVDLGENPSSDPVLDAALATEAALLELVPAPLTAGANPPRSGLPSR